MSYRSLAAKPLNASLKTLLKRSGHIGVGLGTFAPVLALANPIGGQVIAGQATIAAPSASGMVITQKSQSAIINWQQFNIGAGQYVQFLQPSSSSVVLNRVIGGSASSILGNLTGNGQVFLVNTNGVYFGKGSSIDTQGFLASTLGISNQNFLTHNYVFDEAGAPGAEIVNQGNITAHHSGYVVLAGDYVENDGVIAAQSGHVILASGTKATLSLNGNSLINFAVNQSTLANYAGVKNTGSILADGGTVIMTADVANLLKATVVNNTGLVEAHAISNTGGLIQLLASGGNIQNAGTIDVSATRTGQVGGQITLKGNERTTLTDTSNIDATGQGAKGGSVEVSGQTIAMRGAMNLGKGGNLLLDPTNVEIVAGTHASSNAHSTASGENGSVGLTFIENQLNAGANVQISAHTKIFASGGVDNITATGKGNLGFKTAPGGQVALAGVDIAIAGKLTAAMGFGSFGHLTAGSVDLMATGDVNLTRATSDGHGAITKFSAKTTTGALTITAADLRASGSGADGIALQAKTVLTVTGDMGTLAGLSGALPSNVTLMGAAVAEHGSVVTIAKFSAVASAGDLDVRNITAEQGVTLTDTGGDIHLAGLITAATGDIVITDKKGALIAGNNSNAVVSASHGVTINAKNIEHQGSGDLVLQAGVLPGDTLTVNGVFGANAAAGFGHQLVLNGRTINVNNDIKATQLSVFGTHLVYTGKNTTFSLSASDGKLLLDASIGSAAAPVKYNVAISGKDDKLEIQRSIYVGNTAGKAAANINVTETGIDGSHVAGVLVGDPGPTAVVLSAKGSITLTGANVGLGHAQPSSTANIGQLTIKASKNVTITAKGSGSHSGQVGMTAQFGSALSNSVDKAILVQAGGNILVTAHHLHLQGGEAGAVAKPGLAADYDASVTLKANGNVTLQSYGGGGQVDLSGGFASAQAIGSSGDTRTATADAGIDIIAGKAISITGHQIKLVAGRGLARASAGEGADDSATVDTGVDLTAGTNINMAAGTGSISIEAAGTNHASTAGFAVAHGGATAKATVHSDVQLTAGNTISLGAKQITVAAGQSVGGMSSHHAKPAIALASSDGIADFTATGNVGFTAGAGGIVIAAKGGSIGFSGGRDVGYGDVVHAAGGGVASLDAEAKLSFTTTGSITLTATGDIRINAGTDGADFAIAKASAGSANLKTDAGVSMSAKAVTASAGGSLLIGTFGSHHGGFNAFEAHASASSAGHAMVDSEANISITATGGAITLHAVKNVGLEAGYGLAAGSVDSTVEHHSLQTGPNSFSISTITKALHGAQANAFGSGAQAGVKASGTLSLTATGAVSVTQTAASGSIKVIGGADAGYGATLTATHGGHASIGVLDAVSITAGAAVSMKGANIRVNGGAFAGEEASSSLVVHGTKHCISPSSCGPLSSVTTHHVAHQALASGAGAVSQFDTDGSITIKGSSIAVTAVRDANISAGAILAEGARLMAAQGGSVSELHKSSLDLTATGAVTVTAGDETQIEAGLGVAHGAFASDVGSGHASLVADGGVHIQAASLSLAAGEELQMGGGRSAGYGVVAKALGGKATVTADAALDVTVTNAFSAKLTGSSSHGSIALHSGRRVVEFASVNGTSGQGSVTGHGDVDITVTGSKGTITLDTGKHAHGWISVGVDSAQAEHAFAAASHLGTATVTGTADVDLSAKGTVSLHAGGSLGIFAASGYQAEDVGADAGAGAKAKLSASGSVNISGGNLSLAAGGSVFIGMGGSRVGSDAELRVGTAGSAGILSENDVNITASGTLSITAGKALTVQAAGKNHGLGALLSIASHDKNAKSSLDIESDINLSGNTGVSLTAKGDVGIFANSSSGHVGLGAHISAASHDTVTMKDVEDVSIVTKGTLSIIAQDLKITGGSEVGYGAVVNAAGAGAKATFIGGGSINVSAASVKISAARSIKIEGGFLAGANDNGVDIQANNGGAATLDADAGVTITAGTAFSAKLTGAGHSGSLEIFGGSGAGRGASLSAKTGGKAGLDATAGVAIDVTAKGGTLTIATGKGAQSIDIDAGSDGLSDLFGTASNAAAVTATADSGVELSALGAITLTAAGAGLNITSGDRTAKGLSIEAVHGGHATVSAVAGVDITGSTLTMTAKSIFVVGGSFENGAGMKIHANSGGSADVDVDVSTDLQALTGGINLTATGGNVTLLAAGQGPGTGIAASAGVNAKATATLTDDLSLTAATNIAISAKSSAALSAGGRGSAAGSVQVHAAHGATATVAESEDIVITAGGTFTATAGAKLLLAGGGELFGGGDSYANDDIVTANGARAKASLTEDGTLFITAKSLAVSASTVDLGGGKGAGMDASVDATGAGAATLKVSAGVSLDATGGSIAIRGKKSINVLAGSRAGAGNSRSHSGGTIIGATSGSHSHVTSHSNNVNPTQLIAHGSNATARYDVDASVNLTATGAINLTQTNVGAGTVAIAAGGSAGAVVHMAASNGLASMAATANVNISAGGAVSVKGFEVKVNGGRDAGRGAGHTSFESSISHCIASNCTPTRHSFTSHGNPIFAEGVNGQALLGATAGVDVTGAAIALTAGDAMKLTAGGNGAAGHASIVALGSGSAAVTVQTGIKFTTPGAFTATAVNQLLVTANSASYAGNLGEFAQLMTHTDGRVTLTGSNDVVIDAKTVSLTATKGSLSIAGGNGIGSHIQMHADSSGDQITAALSGKVDITATTTLSLSGLNVKISGGNSGGKSADLTAANIASSSLLITTPARFASVSLDTDGSLSFTAGGAITVKAAESFHMHAGGFGARSAQLVAYGSSASARLDGNEDVNFTAASLAITAGSNLSMSGGFLTGDGAQLHAGHQGRAELDLEVGVDITTTGAVSLTATRGEVGIFAGHGSFVRSPALIEASDGATGTLSEKVNTLIDAGTTLTVKAAEDVIVRGGTGLFASGDGAFGVTTFGGPAASQEGVVNMTVDGSTALKAGANLSVIAGGSLRVLGGSDNGMAIDLFPSHTHTNQASISTGPAGGGKVTGQMAAGVSLTAGDDVNLQAGGDLTVAAGAGVTLAVGMTRVLTHTISGTPNVTYLGDSWAGGSAGLTADVSTVVTAGHDLTVTAGAGGAGDLQVEGLRPGDFSTSSGRRYYNVAAVRGGSSAANAVVSLTGNATLNAGSDIIVNAKGNASIVGGSLQTLRADHTRGNVTITGSVDAALHAAHDVVLNNITGSLTVAGINVNASHQGTVFVVAFGSTGHAVVTGHADALISAGNAVRTVTAIGKGINVVAGNNVVVAAIGSSGNVANLATGTANASIVAGGSVTITAKGDLNMLGGQGGLVSVGAGTHAGPSHSISGAVTGPGNHSGSRVAMLSATAGIFAKGAVAINAAGSGVVAGGDGLKAVASFSYHGSSTHPIGQFGFGEASGNVSAGITAGTTLGLTIGHSLLVRGGSADSASVAAFGVFKTGAQAGVTSQVNLVSGGDMTLNVGLSNHGDASFVAGSGALAKSVIHGIEASAQAAIHVDANVQTGGNLTLNVGRNLTVAGGPATELGSFTSHGFESAAAVFGDSDTAKTAVTAHTTFTVAGNLTATLHGGDAIIEAGGSVAVLRAVISEGPGDATSLTADAGITIHAGGALNVAGAGSVGILPGLLPLFSSAGNPPAITASSNGGPARATIVSSVKISGKGVNINGDKNVFVLKPASSLSFPSFFSSGGIRMDGTVSIVSTSGAPIVSVSPLSVRVPQSLEEGVRLAPMVSTTGFGGVQPMSFMSTTDAAGSAPLWTTPVSSTSGTVQTTSKTLSLDTLQSQALVVSLVTVVAPTVADQDAQPVLFSPGDLTADFASRFPSSCAILLQKDLGADARCKVGGR